MEQNNNKEEFEQLINLLKYPKNLINSQETKIELTLIRNF